MNDYIVPVVFLTLVFIMAAVVFWSRTPLQRALSYCGFLILVSVLWQAVSGLPRHVYDFLPPVLSMPAQGQMIGFIPDEPRAIYIIEVTKDAPHTPIMLQLPWNEKLAAKLAELMKQETAYGGTIIITSKNKNKDESESLGDAGKTGAYLKPPKSPPPKQPIHVSPEVPSRAP